MTPREREIAKRLHPDKGGNAGIFAYFMERARHKAKRYAKCICGVTIRAGCKRCRTCNNSKVAAALLCAGCVSTSTVNPPMPTRTTIAQPIVLPAFHTTTNAGPCYWMVQSTSDFKTWQFEGWIDGTLDVPYRGQNRFYRLLANPVNTINLNKRP